MTSQVSGIFNSFFYITLRIIGSKISKAGAKAGKDRMPQNHILLLSE
jgi:hypothetical protein